ncbi:MAG: TrkA family potassium uptake protein [Cyanobacteria bacterium J06648_16]
MKIILIGTGKLTYFLAKQFVMAGYALSVISQDENQARALSRQVKATVIVGDGSNPMMLEEAAVEQADVVLALTPHDQDNLVACQIAHLCYGVGRTIALVHDPSYQPVFERLGVTVAFSETQILASLIEQQAEFFDIKSLFPVAAGQVNVTELVLEPDSPAIGQTLQTLDLPNGSLIACIIRQQRMIVPQGSSCLQPDDRLILISQPEANKALILALTGSVG